MNDIAVVHVARIVLASSDDLDKVVDRYWIGYASDLTQLRRLWYLPWVPWMDTLPFLHLLVRTSLVFGSVEIRPNPVDGRRGAAVRGAVAGRVGKPGSICGKCPF